MMRVKGDALFALVLFGIFSFGTYRSLVMDNPFGGPADVGAAFFPFWVCVFIQILSLGIFLQSVFKTSRADAPSGGDPTIMRKRVMLFIGILALLFIYILVMDTVGFILSSASFLVFVHQLLVFAETGRISPPKGLVFSVIFFSVTSGLLYFLFNTVFRLALP
ncbi:MAG: tripartite tricarboxylate transporter TctB family protein [Rhodospirillales bacterium]|nr:tripartite tricarboxylate transporter TctB family protein [Rhodospirillales bacterium]